MNVICSDDDNLPAELLTDHYQATVATQFLGAPVQCVASLLQEHATTADLRLEKCFRVNNCLFSIAINLIFFCSLSKKFGNYF